MYSLTYYSIAESHFPEDQLVKLVERAQEKNRRIGVTGFLYFDSKARAFLQYLEGNKQQVESLMAEIKADDRHRVLQVIEFAYRDERLFKDWGMRQVDPTRLRTIGLEDVLQITLKCISSRAMDETKGHEIVERLVTRIAESQDRLAAAG